MRKLLCAILLLGLAASPATPQITTLGTGVSGRASVTVNTRVTNTGDTRITNTSNVRVTQ